MYITVILMWSKRIKVWRRMMIPEDQCNWIEEKIELSVYELVGVFHLSIGIMNRECWGWLTMQVFFRSWWGDIYIPQQLVPDWGWHWHTLLFICLTQLFYTSSRVRWLMQLIMVCRKMRVYWSKERSCEWWCGVAKSSTRVTGGWCNESYSSPTSHCNMSSQRMDSATLYTTFKSWRWSFPRDEDEDFNCCVIKTGFHELLFCRCMFLLYKCSRFM